MVYHLIPALRFLLITFFCLAAMATSAAFAAAPPKLTLVEDGKPQATIVIATDATDHVKAAAAELQDYVRRITGAELPIVDDQRDVAGVKILVGRSALTDQLKGKIPTGQTHALREEGYILKSLPGALVVAGNDTPPYLGSRFAVSELLHRLGVRWVIPGEFGEVVPTMTTITLEPLDVEEHPTFAVRDWWTHNRGNMTALRTEWKIRNRMSPRSVNGLSDYFGLPGDSSVRAFMPPPAMMEEHPEMFALNADGSRNAHLPNMTSEATIQWFADKIIERAEAGARWSSFAPDDGYPQDNNPETLRIASRFLGEGGDPQLFDKSRSITEEWMQFVRRVAAKVHALHPTHVIHSNGYANRDMPPEADTIGDPDRVAIMFANIGACAIHGYGADCWEMHRQGQMLKRWTHLSNYVYLYNYNYVTLVGKETLTPMITRARQNFPLWKQWGVWGFMSQEDVDWSLNGIPTRYLRARLMWNADADVDAELADLYDKWFGPAAGPMAAYYEALDGSFASSNLHAHEDPILPDIYTAKLVATLRGHMQAAIKAAPAEPYKTRVRLERLMFEVIECYQLMEAAKDECDYAEAVEQVDGMIYARAEMQKITPFMGWRPYPVYGTAWEKKRLEKLRDMTQGETSKLIQPLPLNPKFKRDAHDDGRFERWQEPTFDDADWAEGSSANGWEAAGHQITDDGRPYRGIGWYRFSVNTDQWMEGARVHLYAPAIISEAWVWVNGQYVGRREWKWCWIRPHEMDLDVTDALKPGAENQITIRVKQEADNWGASGIYERPFIYQASSEAEESPP